MTAFLVLSALAITEFAGRSWLAMLFFIVVLAWSLLSVSSTALVTILSSANEGEGMGIFNATTATTAVAGVTGAAVGGLTATLWGYAEIVSWE